MEEEQHPGKLPSPINKNASLQDAPVAASTVKEDVHGNARADLTAGIEPKAPNHSNEPVMEIHTHGHVHETKKWKEYLFQFLMLFLAVTAGFFMENQREHYVENHRAHELAASLVKDLQADTSEVTTSGKRMVFIVATADTLLHELDKPRKLQNDSLVQLAMYRLSGYNFYDPQMGTYQQIKSSGALRYFKSSISEKMTRYEGSTNYIGRLTDDAMAFRTQVLLPFFMDIQNGRFVEAVVNKMAYNGPYFREEPNAETIDRLYNRAGRLKSLYKWYVERIGDHRVLAEELITLLRQEYKLEE